MKGALGGFTIIEVMIVLAISGVMLISAATIFNGRRQTTEFSQAMYDLQSQFQSIANSVSAQAIPGVQQYTCAPASINGIMRPVLSVGSTTNQDCIYLGQAIQVAPGSAKVSSYPIFGLRTIYNGPTDSGDAPTTAADAHPEPAISAAGLAIDSTNPNNLLLVNSYGMLNGLSTFSAQLGGADNGILTLFSSIQDSNTSGNEISVNATNHPTSPADPRIQMKECIESIGVTGPPTPPCATFTPITTTPWKLCVSDGSRQAQLSVKAIATGIVTSLDMNGCS